MANHILNRSNNRREFLTAAGAAAAVLAVPSLAQAEGESIASQRGTVTNAGRTKEIFKPEFQLGLGGVPLGNEFEVVTDDDAMKTLEASWKAGVRYFDVSPCMASV